MLPVRERTLLNSVSRCMPLHRTTFLLVRPNPPDNRTTYDSIYGYFLERERVRPFIFKMMIRRLLTFGPWIVSGRGGAQGGGARAWGHGLPGAHRDGGRLQVPTSHHDASLPRPSAPRHRIAQGPTRSLHLRSLPHHTCTTTPSTHMDVEDEEKRAFTGHDGAAGGLQLGVFVTHLHL